MIRYIYAIIIAFVLTLAVPTDVCAAEFNNYIEQEQQPVVAVTGNSNLHVQNANGQTVYVYNVAGVVVQTVKVMGQDVNIELNLPKGCYIIKVGKTVRKISVK